MPDGAIIATIFNQPCHGAWGGDVDCWVSEDEGRFWRLRGTPARHEPGTNRMNVAAGLANNGDLLILASGWTHRPRKDERAGGFDGAHPLLPLVCRSSDGGRTWTHSEALALPDNGSDRLIPFGDIVQLREGTLGVCIYGCHPPEEHKCYFYTSTDDGRTWNLRAAIQENDINETTPLVLKSGHLLACSRTVGDQHLELFRSTDHGRTWQREQAVSGSGEVPAHLLLLADGSILLTYGLRTYGNKTKKFRGVGYRVSCDDGRTWSSPVVLYESDHRAGMNSDGGYPSSVELDDGTIVTAFYSSCAPQFHDRYHMGVIRWTLDKQ
jgi:hypothetical protein